MNEQQAPHRRDRSPLTRAHTSFWILVGLAVLMTGTVSASLAAPPSPLTGISFAISALALIISMALAARVMAAIQRTPRQPAGRAKPRINRAGRTIQPRPARTRPPRRRTASPPPGRRTEERGQ